MQTKILIRRAGALGDVLLTTPVVHRLRKENPDAIIDIETNNPTAYQGPYWKNPDISNILHTATGEYHQAVELNMASERNRTIHQIDAYFETAFSDHGKNAEEKQIIFPFEAALDRLPEFLTDLDWNLVVCIHPNISWPNRCIPNPVWKGLTEKLNHAGYTVGLLGTRIDQTIDSPWIVDSRGLLDLCQQAAVISKSRALVCGTSSLLSLAGATEIPIVCFFTITKSEQAFPFRHGLLGWNCAALTPDIACYGCSEKAGAVTYVGCARGDLACLSLFNAETAFQTVTKAIERDRRKS